MAGVHLTAFVLSLMVILTKADFQLELVLVEYENPRGFNLQEMCCEPESAIEGQCLPQETCDTLILVRVENFDFQEDISRTYSLGPYENTDYIQFPNCSMLAAGVPNPLVFTFSTSDFAIGNTIRVFFDISDEDIDPVTNSFRVTSIAPNTLFEIYQPGGTNGAFSGVQMVGAAVLADLYIRFQYRLICTPGSCGADCSQTIGCSSFPTGCACLSNSDCSNGASCQEGDCIAPPNTELPTTPAGTGAVSTGNGPVSTGPGSTMVTAATQGFFMASRVIKTLFTFLLLSLIMIF